MSKQVNIGERYRDRSAVWTQWEVQRVYLDLLGLPHAIVVGVSDDMERRTIACPTLLDRRRFELVDVESEIAAMPPPTGLSVSGSHRARGGYAAPHH